MWGGVVDVAALWTFLLSFGIRWEATKNTLIFDVTTGIRLNFLFFVFVGVLLLLFFFEIFLHSTLSGFCH